MINIIIRNPLCVNILQVQLDMWLIRRMITVNDILPGLILLVERLILQMYMMIHR